MTWILVLHENQMAQSTAAGLLEEVFSPDAVFTASNLAEARELFDQHGRANCKLVVSSFSPPADADTPQALDRTQATAVELLKEIRRNKEVPPWIFLVSFDDGTRAPDLAGTPNVEVHSVLNIAKQLRKRALAMTGRGGAVMHRADVDISLLDGKYTWSLKGTNGRADERSGAFDLEPKALHELMKASQLAPHAGHQDLRQIGSDLYGHFLANIIKSKLALALQRAVGDSVEDARFRFCVDELTNQLLVETLGMPAAAVQGADLEHWMLRAPIFRKYRGDGGRYPLFKDRVSQSQPVSCLIVQGASAAFEPTYRLDSGEYVPVKYRAIGEAAAEAGKLYDYLQKNHERFGLQPPELLQPGKAADYGGVVRKTLESQPWQLIHYVGHSGMSPRGTAFLALGKGSKDVLEIAELARLASSAQFVFLNSCQSSNAQFVRELVARNIPSVLGYAWPIEDDVASRFAESFYRHLFEGGPSKRFLEYAFMRSKRDMHYDLPDKTAWAAPLLFLQLLGGESARAH